MQRYNNTVVSPTGQAIAGASIVVTVAANPPGSGGAAQVFAGDGLTPISNTVIADNLGRFGFFVPDGKYDLTVSGGTPTITIPYVLAAVEVTDLLEFNALDSQPITVQTLNLTQVLGGATPPTGTINLYSKALDSRLYYKDPLGTEIGPLVAGGGAGSPAGLSGDVQKNSGTGFFAASSINDNGSRVLVSENTIFRGPNLGVDVTAFGVRAVNPNVIPSPTATITAGSNSVVVSSTVGLQVGDGLAIVGAGAAQSMAAPIAPTVTPSCAAGLTGLGYTVPAGAGSTSYQYQLAMRDKGQGMTASGSPGSTSTGNATLGAKSTAITSIASGSSNVFTATVGSTADLAAGCLVVLKGTTNDGEFGGWKIIQSIVDGTHFTFTSGVDASKGISTTTATGGTAMYWLCNHIVLPTPGAGGTQYAIYGRAAGSMNFLQMSLLANLGYTDPTYNTFDDYGSPMMDGGPRPWFVSTTPPVSPAGDTLVTTITNISGTTLSLVDNASTSVTSAPARFDNAPGILASLTASNSTSVTGAGGTIRFPVVVESPGTGNYCYATSSYVSTAANAVIQDGAVCLGDTLQLTGTNWYGTDNSAARLNQPPNATRAHIPILIQGANPGIWVKSTGGLNKVSVNLTGNGGVGVFNAQMNAAQVFEDDNFSTNITNDYMSIGFYDYQPSVSGGFGGKMRNTSWAGGPDNVTVGRTATPIFATKFSAEWDFDYVSCYARGYAFIPFIAGLFGKFHMGEECQGNIMPLVTIMATTAGNTGGYFTLEGVVVDTAPAPTLANLSPTVNNGTSAVITIFGANAPSAGQPLISGKPFFGGVALLGYESTTIGQIGQNINIMSTGQRGQNYDVGLFASQLTLGQTTFASLGAPTTNGKSLYCSDCTITNPCAGGGTGAFAKCINNTWVCS